jgi:hypothetical protein
MKHKNIHTILLVKEVGFWKRHVRNMLQDKVWNAIIIKEGELEETVNDQIDEK